MKGGVSMQQSIFRVRFTAFFVIVLCLIVVPSAGLAAAAKSEESSAYRGVYLANRGIIIPEEEIYEDSYISSVDFHYPDPEGPFGVWLFSGHRQVSTEGQDEILLIGIQGKRMDFEELPPLNLAFVIDKSGSMASQDKMEWVKESFEIFINRVRETDFVSLVVFDSMAKTLFPSTRIGQRGARQLFRNAVQSIRPGGGTNLVAGLQLGYEQVMSNFRKQYVNRVLFLTDGVGNSAGILEMAKTYRDLGIGISTIGLGKDFDLDLMRDLAKEGGGSSRFISDRERMEDTFGSGLSRMVVPAVKDLELELQLAGNLEVVKTYGYDHEIQGQRIRFSLPAVHCGDYETILIQVKLPEQQKKTRHQAKIAHLSGVYRDLTGEVRSLKPVELSVEFLPSKNPVDGFSDANVLRAGTLLHCAEALKRIGARYYDVQKLQTSGQLYRERMRGFIAMTNDIKKEILNARERLDYEGFEKELSVLEKYIRIFGGNLSLESPQIDEIVEDREIAPVSPERDLTDHLDNLFREIALDLQSRKPGNIALSGFSLADGRSAGILTLIDRAAEKTLFDLPGFQILERENIESMLKEQELALSDLMETTEAIRVGQFLSAQYILTGTIVEMQKSIVIFGRVINVESAAIESVSQVIVPRRSEVNSLL